MASVFSCSGEAEVSTESETSPDDAGDDHSVIDEGGPESVKNLVLKSRNGLRDAIPQAPEEIRDDLATVLVGFEKVIEILRTYEFDFFAASSETESGRQMVLDGMTE